VVASTAFEADEALAATRVGRDGGGEAGTAVVATADLGMAGSLAVIARDAGKESVYSFPLSTYSALGDLRQDPGRAAESLAEARTCGNGSSECVCCVDV
jgi:hypothetical protein